MVTTTTLKTLSSSMTIRIKEPVPVLGKDFPARQYYMERSLAWDKKNITEYFLPKAST
jgi:hypothetical protein